MIRISSMKKASKPQLIIGHLLLHRWAKNNYQNKPKSWTRTQIKTEHGRVAKELIRRGYGHRSPI